MTEQQKYNAVKENDERFDGVFFYGVASTNVFCRPSCKSRRPKKDNVRFFNSPGDAVKKGYRPCKRCRPDLYVYQPIKDAAEKTKQLIDSFYKEKTNLRNEFKNMGFSPHRIIEIFKNEYGITPKQYADGLRIKQAKKLLMSTDNDIIDIAHTAGFASLSSFYRAFKADTGMPPAKYRRQKGGK